MKLAIAGSGKIVTHLLSVLSTIPEIELAAIASRASSLDKNKSLAQQYGIREVYSTVDEMFEKVSADAIYIATPNSLHYEMCKKALECGFHVICEKPFTTNLDELEALNQLAHAKGKILLEAITVLYLPNVHLLKEKIEQIGFVSSISLNFSQRSSRYDEFLTGKIHPVFDSLYSGGALMDLNIYNIHLMTFLFGQPDFVEYVPVIENGIDTSGVIQLQYGSLTAFLKASKTSSENSQNIFEGDKGTLVLEGPSSLARKFHVILKDTDKKMAESYDLQHGNDPMLYEFKAFHQMIENQNFQAANQMMHFSLMTMETAQRARYQAGLFFDKDHKH